MRPDGRAPLIGDTDSGQVLPINQRRADDHAYLLAPGAVVFGEPRFKLAAGQLNEELLWLLGADGVSVYEKLATIIEPPRSQGFADAGTYVTRADDLYLLLNASDSGLEGRGSHGHNDALSLEVSACHRSFIVDPGTFVYTASLSERHLFRSTAYHSTVEVDGVEQNSTDAATPFVIGNEARPRVLRWDVTTERDTLVAEHYGYRRLALPVTHRRAVEFDKRERRWIIEDALLGAGAHEFRFRFHFADGLDITVRDETCVQALDKSSGARLFVMTLDFDAAPELEPRFVSRDYGAKSASLSACWTLRASSPLMARWAIVPLCAGFDEAALTRALERLKSGAEQALSEP
jgi:hypothetical protein